MENYQIQGDDVKKSLEKHVFIFIQNSCLVQTSWQKLMWGFPAADPSNQNGQVLSSQFSTDFDVKVVEAAAKAWSSWGS